MQPHAPTAAAWLADSNFQQMVERTVMRTAAHQLGETEWTQQLTDDTDPRHAVHIGTVRDDEVRLALAVMLSGLRRHPRAWVQGVENALRVVPQARPAVLDVMRVHGPRQRPEGDEALEWHLSDH